MSFLVQAWLLDRYKRPRLTMQELAEVLGMSYGTLRNKLAAGDFPVRTYLDEGRRWADVRDVAAHLDQLRESTQVEGADTA